MGVLNFAVMWCFLISNLMEKKPSQTRIQNTKKHEACCLFPSLVLSKNISAKEQPVGLFALTQAENFSMLG